MADHRRCDECGLITDPDNRLTIGGRWEEGVPSGEQRRWLHRQCPDVPVIRCADCGEHVAPEDTVCSACGSGNREIETGDDATAYESDVRLAGRFGKPGEIRPYIEATERIRWCHDRQRYERCFMLVNREHDHYMQEWRDLDTSEVTYSKMGRLSDPNMHGRSARP